MKKDALSINMGLFSKSNDISSILKQSNKKAETKKLEVDLLGYMRKIEEERKFQAEKELILKDLDENLDKIRDSFMAVSYSGLQSKLSEMLVSSTEGP
jgi:hypothetical protein